MCLPFSHSPRRRVLRLPLLDEGPIEQGEQGAIGRNDGIMGKQLRHGRLVKDMRRGYHSRKLLLWVECFSDLYYAKGVCFRASNRDIWRQKGSESRAKLLALPGMWASIRHMIVKVIGFDHGITCSGICRGSSSTLCVRKRQIRVIHYLRLSIFGLK